MIFSLPPARVVEASNSTQLNGNSCRIFVRAPSNPEVPNT